MNGGSQTEKINDYNGRDYRTVWKHPRAVFEDRFEGATARRLVTKKPGWFVDIGAGYGRSYPITKMPGRKVVLVDYALNLLEMAAQQYADEKDLYFVAANAYHLPFKNGVFDGGISIRVFHHMNLPDTFLKECSRVMQCGAEVLMQYANKRNLFRVFRRGKKSLQKDHEEYEPLHFGTHPAYFERIARDAGFSIDRISGTGFFPRFIKEKTLFVVPLLSIAERLFDATFGRLGLSPLHFAGMRKVCIENQSIPFPNIEDILQCPQCGGALDLHTGDETIRCMQFQHTFKRRGNILDLRYQPEIAA